VVPLRSTEPWPHGTEHRVGVFGGGADRVEVALELPLERVGARVLDHPRSNHSRTAERPAWRWYLTAPSESFIDAAISRTESLST
jgi:hypothetical protein